MEIENAKAVGAIAVGVASVEDNVYNMNADKRERLIRAGADIIIPDFREGEHLVEYTYLVNSQFYPCRCFLLDQYLII